MSHNIQSAQSLAVGCPGLADVMLSHVNHKKNKIPITPHSHRTSSVEETQLRENISIIHGLIAALTPFHPSPLLLYLCAL